MRSARTALSPLSPKATSSNGRKIEAKQHFTEPPPRYSEATLIKKMEELGIGRPSTYASTLNVLARPRICPARQEAALSRGQGAPRHRVPRELLPPLCRIRLHRRPRGEARPDLGRQARMEGRAARLLARVHRRRERYRRFAHHRGARCAERHAWAAHLPRHRSRRRSARLPLLRDRPLEPQGRQVRRLHRLLQLSRLPLHPPARRHRRQDGRARQRRQAARHRSRDRARRDAPHRPLRALRPARRERRGEAEARLDPQGHRSGGHRS